jgi:tripartite-type tricarboxylate transporter receptor subunit TctC
MQRELRLVGFREKFSFKRPGGSARRGCIKAGLASVMAAAIVVAQNGTPALADSESDFFQGKTISLIVGFPPGGGYDAYARLVARYYGDHLPTAPTVVVKNMAGASGVLSGNYLYEVAPRDGTTISLFNNSMPTYELLKQPGVRYRSTDFNWLGSIDSSNSVIVVTRDAGVQDVADLQKKEVLMGAVSTSGTMAWYPALMNHLLGTRFKIIVGYEGGNTINLAMERGEINGVGSSPWTTWVARRPDWIKSGWIIPIVQLGLEKDANIPAPLLLDMAPDDRARKIIQFISTDIGLGRLMVAPPKVAEVRVHTLRRALDATMSDPKLLAEAKTSELDISPVSGEKITALIMEKMSTPPEVIAQSQQATMVKGQKKQ